MSQMEGLPEAWFSKTAVEEFIAVHNLKIKPKYNVFPARPYDSMAVWGKK